VPRIRYLWRDNRVQINEVDVAKRQLITNASTISPTGVFPLANYYAYNLYEELDVPGEFAADARSGVLSAILPAGCIKGDGTVACKTRLVPSSLAANDAALTFSVLKIKGGAHITLRGVNVTGSVGAGITVDDSRNITLDQCHVNNVDAGVSIDAAVSTGTKMLSHNISLLRSEVAFTMGASTVWSGGDRTTLTPPGFLCENNKIHDFGRWIYTYQAGAHVAGVGVVVRKNLFYSSYHVAILFGGNDHLFELNEIRNVATIGYDTGAIYGGRDLSSRGTAIKHNFFHSLDNPAPCNMQTSCIRMAIYIDDFEGGVEISGNIFYRVPTGFFSNCGGDFSFRNNLYVDVGTSIRQSGHSGFGSVQQYIWQQLHKVPFTDPLWVSRFPELARRFSDWKNGSLPPDPGTTITRNNVYSLNAIVNTTGPVKYQGGRFDNWTANADGMFSLPAPWYTPNAANTTQYFDIKRDNTLTANPDWSSGDPIASLNFSLKPSSPLFKKGWKAIPQGDIGPSNQ
jgi:hypothetical protein